MTTMTIAEAARIYLAKSGRIRTEQSRRTVTGMLRNLAAECHTSDIRKVTTEQLTAFCMKPAKSRGGSKDMYPEHQAAPGTIRARRSQLQSFFGWLAFMGYVTNDPSTKLKYTVKFGHFGVVDHTWLDAGQLARLLELQPGERGQRDRLVMFVAGFTGMRVSELSAIRWNQFSSDLSSITFVGKGAKIATIGIPSQLQAELVSWRKVCRSDQIVFPSYRIQCGFAEPMTKLLWEVPLGDCGIRNIVKEHGARIGAPSLRPHDLRRSYANVLENLGVPIEKISLALRHENIGTTSIYLSKNPKKAVAVAASFNIDMS